MVFMQGEEKPACSDVLVPPTLVFCPEHDGQNESVPEGIAILLTNKKGKKYLLQRDSSQLTMLELVDNDRFR